MAITILSGSANVSNPARPAIGYFFPDINTKEDATFRNKITDAPIETGETVTDHVFYEPLRLEIEGVTGAEAYTINPSAGTVTVERGRVRVAYETLKQLAEEREPFEVVTGYDLYPNMLIEELNLPRDPMRGDALFFSAILKQVTTVETRTSTIARVRRAAPAQRRKLARTVREGRKQTVALPEAQAAKLQELGGPFLLPDFARI